MLTARLLDSPSSKQGCTSPMTPKSGPRSFPQGSFTSLTENFPTSVPSPRTPSPPPNDEESLPLRYPETLESVIVVREAEGKGLGVFAARDGKYPIPCDQPITVS
jgi:hypothetical protein